MPCRCLLHFQDSSFLQDRNAQTSVKCHFGFLPRPKVATAQVPKRSATYVRKRMFTVRHGSSACQLGQTHDCACMTLCGCFCDWQGLGLQIIRQGFEVGGGVVPRSCSLVHPHSEIGPGLRSCSLLHPPPTFSATLDDCHMPGLGWAGLQ